jgi:DNA-binding MarR family transcriptional regulator
MKSSKKDYLKYWKPVKFYIKRKYNLQYAEIDMILFLYSEDKFTKAQFDEFNKILPWDLYRFKKLVRNGWIESFRKFKGRVPALYSLSDKGNNLCKYIYETLEGSKIAESKQHNPLFKKNITKGEMKHQDIILKMNSEVVRRQRRAPEQS